MTAPPAPTTTTTTEGSPVLDDDPTTNPCADKPTAGVFLVTPQTAARWLATRNTRNRARNETTVRRYAADMAGGRWHMTGAPLQFDRDGLLIDGQHRLEAIVRSGVSLPLFIVRGLETSAQDYVDTGRKRLLGDQLRIAGHRDYATLAAGARLAYLWETDQLNRGTKAVSDAEVRAFLDTEPALTDAATLARNVYTRGLDCPPGVVAATAWRFVKVGTDPDQVAEWYGALAEHRTNGAGDPKLALLNRLGARRRSREGLSPVVLVSLVTRAWNADAQGKTLHKLPAHVRGERVEVPEVRKWGGA